MRCATRTKARSLPVSDGPVNWRSILLTPNILGKDGVSALSREMARALPAPALVVSLHDEPTTPDRSPVGVEVRGARGSRLSFIATAFNAMRHADADTTIAATYFTLTLLGYPHVSLYTGSFDEWSRHPELPTSIGEKP